MASYESLKPVENKPFTFPGSTTTSYIALPAIVGASGIDSIGGAEFDPSSIPVRVRTPKEIISSVRNTVLGYEEKRAIAQHLVKLPEVALQSVLDIITKHEPELLNLQGGEWQFDMGELSSGTVWKIKTFIDSWLKRTPAGGLNSGSYPHVGEVGPLSAQEFVDVRAGTPNPELRNSTGVMVNFKVDKLTRSMELTRSQGELKCPHCVKTYVSLLFVCVCVYVCGWYSCVLRFPDSSALVKHVRKHNGEKPHTCEKCGKAFRHSSTLKDHANTHLDVKPHLCQFEGCGKRFANMANLKRHERIHTSASFLCLLLLV